MTEPAAATEPTTEEIERLLAEVPIFRMLSPADVHALALGQPGRCCSVRPSAS